MHRNATFVLEYVFLLLLAVFVLWQPKVSEASTFAFVSDTITNSAPSATTTTHTILFTVINPIAPNGALTIAFDANGTSTFNIPPALDFTDLVFEVASGGPFVTRTLGAAPGAGVDGVGVVSGASGSITITLSSTLGLSTSDQVRITIGGADYVTSAPNENSYRVRLSSYTPLAAAIDIGTAMIALVAPIDVTNGAGNVIPPVRSNGLPTGLLPGATTNVLVSLNTDVPALCKFSTTTASTSFALMSSSTIFTTANNRTLHFIPTPVFQNDIFTYYVRCENDSFIDNTDDYIITFEVGVIPSASSTPLPPPLPPTPSGPSGGGGGGGIFLQGGDVTISGTALPGGSMVILQDGKIVKEEVISVLGDFSSTFTNLQRGTYTWGVYVKDPDGNKSTTYSSTIYLIGKTNNVIAPVYVSPTIKAKTTTVGVGEDIELSGYAIALKPVFAIMNKQGNALSGKIVTGSTTANGNGSWKMKLSTSGLVKGTYEVKVQSIITKGDQSNFSPYLYIGVGQNPNPDFKNRADLNQDGKVNLVDFSILLFNWKTADAVADINQDGTVSLIDFSIMLANWTG